MQSQVELMRNYNAAGAGFLMTELDVATSFITAAMGTNSVERKQRLLDGAKRAFNQAHSMHPRFQLTRRNERKFARTSASLEKAFASFESDLAPDPKVRRAA
jgi:hypothetical protein